MHTVNSDKNNILSRNDFFADGESFHIDLSTEFPYYIGIPHSHNFIEVEYVVSGSVIHSVDGKTTKAKKGDFFIINTGTSHCFYADEGTDEPFILYDLKFTPDFFDASLKDPQGFEALDNIFMFYTLFHTRGAHKPCISVTGNMFTAFDELFNKIYLEFKRKEKGYMEIIRAYLTQLIILAFRKAENDAKNVMQDAHSRIADYINTYIKNNFASKISVKNLSEQVGLNSDYMGRVFKAKTGHTISETIQKVRIKNACAYLMETDATVSEISEKCGFDDERFFYKIFMRHIGTSPGLYRKDNKKI